ncbi:MAG: histidine ammonia-lyase [Candidatus Eremiobacteraeota bacterium]|jgi:histidine ammonia-lyase|nr:histidine ammonia-lyase [Candidatus Eremiobacteraeota bacterium]
MASQRVLVLRPGELRAHEVRMLLRDGVGLALDPAARDAVDRAAAVVASIAAGDEVVYGVNTGFGKLAYERISHDKLAELQRNLVVSHACGVGPLLSRDVVRLVLALKINSLARGYSGVRWTVIEALLALLERDVIPAIPSQGSVGASGDLAPLAHLAGALIGVGDVLVGGRVVPAAEALPNAGIPLLVLQAKEGLALLNGTQVSTALALDGLIGAEDLLAASLGAGALTVEASLGSAVPFDPRISAVRGHPEQSEIAAALRPLIAGTEINASHEECERVQDPYSVRCMPQVLGACLRTLRDAAEILIEEANGVSDNPIVFSDTGEVLSGGNFHAEPVALVADMLAVAIAEIGNMSERRAALLLDPSFSRLPAFLATRPGLESGYMIAQVTAAALASENKGLAHPASVDTIPTSAGQEDHVSMATHAARRLGDMLRNAQNIVAVELLSAARGIGFRRPLRTSAVLEEMLTDVAPDGHHDGDRYLSPEIVRVAEIVRSGRFTAPFAQLFATTRTR